MFFFSEPKILKALETETQIAVLVVLYSVKYLYLQMLMSNDIHFFLHLVV